eukprot:TRINITY_DN1817_c0_g1_i17.p1 TRINITY_DN1817_c0_g1~~TRINITY_DN1817_c0_g1_i17.p1  ORF type:complete len:355 (-),score=42.42 TRINITY_DN1817_c0_g1_i17:2806-3870(-)
MDYKSHTPLCKKLLLMVVFMNLLQVATAMDNQPLNPSWQVAFLNICGLSLVKWKLVDIFMQTKNIIAMGLSEVHLNGTPSLAQVPPNLKIITNHTPSGRKNQVVWVTTKATNTSIIKVPDELSTNIVGISITTEMGKYNILNVYLPCIASHKTLINSKLIIGGDFNARLKESDKGNTNVLPDSLICNWITQNNLKIIKNHKNSYKWTYKKGKSWSRIDHIITSPCVNTSKITTYAESPSPDHFPISIQLSGRPISYNFNAPNKTKFDFSPQKALPNSCISTIMNIANNTLVNLPKTRFINQNGKKVSHWNTESGITISQIKWATRARRNKKSHLQHSRGPNQQHSTSPHLLQPR